MTAKDIKFQSENDKYGFKDKDVTIVKTPVGLYKGCTKYNLLDTKTPKVGGSGIKFDWQILSQYTSETPFLLSGGLDLEDVEAIKELKNPALAGVDLNSKFETAPALKDAKKLEAFFRQLRNN